MIHTSSPQPFVIIILCVIIVDVGPNSSVGDAQRITVQAALIVGDLKVCLVLRYSTIRGDERETKLIIVVL
jgi:hypothetical protein